MIMIVIIIKIRFETPSLLAGLADEHAKPQKSSI